MDVCVCVCVCAPCFDLVLVVVKKVGRDQPRVGQRELQRLPAARETAHSRKSAQTNGRRERRALQQCVIRNVSGPHERAVACKR